MEINKIYFGDCRTLMREWVDAGIKIQCCVTSPPYFGLRDYGHAGQLGLESSVDEYVAAMVDVFRLVRQLLADDGVLWLNLGDSYNAAGRTGHGCRHGFKQATNRASSAQADECRPSEKKLKPKDLIGIPWRVALALQADGWYLRQDIIWHKPNPMPESVVDRCTKAHEYLFLLSKSERYYFDQEAIKQPAAQSSVDRWNQNVEIQRGSTRAHGGKKSNGPMRAVGAAERVNRRSVWTVPAKPYRGAHFAVFPAALIEPCVLAGSRAGEIVFDPFMGSGTTADVAQAFGRCYLGAELNPEYKPLQQDRLRQATLWEINNAS